jgi:hypothetical protein
MKKGIRKPALLLLVFFSVWTSWTAVAQETAGPVFKPEELDQLLAPIALYPDSLLSQILMASTYPLEVVQADRWAKENDKLSGDALAVALEKQPWDPSVKSLVNFPQVLTMMSEKLDWTQKLGDAFLAQQQDVMNTVQKLRKQAQKEGNLESSKEQVVKVENEIIIIESPQPEVVYVPVYNPTVVYGAWAYPSYPPYYYYPPGYVAASTVFSFAAGVAVGAAWGYAWGGCDWHHGDVDIDVNRNTNINNNIDRRKYAEHYNSPGGGGNGRGSWQHDPQHRKGVNYRDDKTASKYNRASTNDVKSRENYRGRDDQGKKDLDKGPAGDKRTAPDKGPASNNKAATDKRPASDKRPAANNKATPDKRPADKGPAANRGPTPGPSSRPSANRGGALNDMDRGGASRNASNRGATSRRGSGAPGGGAPGGGRGGRGGRP